MQTGITLRPFGKDEFRAAEATIELAFHFAGRPEDSEILRAQLDFDRTLGAFAGPDVLGTACVLPFELTVPGGRTPAAGVTMVTVHPVHRRRGILTAMMQRQLADLHEHGEPVAVLRASEASIYGRFGYAPASRELAVDLERGRSELAGAPGSGQRPRLVEPAGARPALAQVYTAAAGGQPGFIGRNAAAWDEVLHDPEHRRNGTAGLRAVLVGDGPATHGYALYRVTPGWQDGLPGAQLTVQELVATSPAAVADLWRFLLDIDLTGTVHAGHRPLDDPLLRLLANPRQARPRLRDGLWLRLVRLGEAMATRRYAAPVDLVLEITDTRCPWNAGRWRLAGDETGATCERTADPADLALDTAVLAGGYLGDPTLDGPAAAGRIAEHRPGALRRLAAALGWTPGPWCPHHF